MPFRFLLSTAARRYPPLQGWEERIDDFGVLMPETLIVFTSFLRGGLLALPVDTFALAPTVYKYYAFSQGIWAALIFGLALLHLCVSTVGCYGKHHARLDLWRHAVWARYHISRVWWIIGFSQSFMLVRGEWRLAGWIWQLAGALLALYAHIRLWRFLKSKKEVEEQREELRSLSDDDFKLRLLKYQPYSESGRGKFPQVA